MKKQFKLGENAIGGIISINKTKTAVKIEALDYYDKHIILSGYYDLKYRNEINNYLNELTSCYYADKITEFIYKN
jgi:hypothetical protein